jgi:hypothetical protein
VFTLLYTPFKGDFGFKHRTGDALFVLCDFFVKYYSVLAKLLKKHSYIREL